MRCLALAAAIIAPLIAASCAPPSQPPPAGPPSGAPAGLDGAGNEHAGEEASGLASQPGLRLPRTVSPEHYRVTLTVLPGDEAFSGEIEIDLALTRPTELLWLNAKELSVSQVSVVSAGARIAARVVPGGEDHLGVAFEPALPAGKAKLTMHYRGAVSAKDDRGVFVEEEGGARFVFTQFESIEARRAFPCFDEPSFKVPWQLSLRVRASEVALSNTPVVSEEPAGDGLKLVRFAETKPLPSYLVAFAVGPFELVDAGKGGKNGTPIRIAVPPGRKADARWAKEATPALLGVLERQLGLPYPYEKLDVVPVPHLASFGAMENPGLITFDMTRSLAKPGDETPRFKRTFGRIMAHEIAHQWFGNLVTSDFWDDIWLNEGFADWMTSRAVAEWQPGWDEAIAQSRATSWAMSEDTLLSARKIRQEIVTKDDILNAFDSITYAKGAAVLSMAEAWLGPDRFMKGVRSYLEKHAHRTARSDDFLAAMAEVGGDEAKTVLASFLDQPGVPLVRAEIACDAGSAPQLRLTQGRLLSVGPAGGAQEDTPDEAQEAAPATSSRWSIPVCYRLDGGSSGQTCAVMSQPSAVVPLGAGRCPTWVMLQAGGTGYYHGAYDGKVLDRLLGRGEARLSTVERVTVLRDVNALVQAGHLPIGDALGAIVEVAKDPEPHLLQEALQIAWEVREAHLPEDLQPAYARFVREVFGSRARTLGLRPKAGEREALGLTRASLVELVATRGGETALVTEARRLTDRYLGDPRTLEAEAVDAVLTIAAYHGDQALFDRLHAALRKEKDGRRRGRLLDAMGAFRKPEIMRQAVSLVLSDELDIRESSELLSSHDERAAAVAFGLVKEHFDGLVERLPAEVRGYLPLVGEKLCDAASAAELEAFFKPRLDRLTGGPRHLAQALESIALCTAQRDVQGASLRTFLQRYVKKG
ncbi:M1 family metallopeptidase [Chondromyces crocatus]|uniref:Aminopeptidase n=1 Tax=Chondromyces crocatus TaxID=52 RepID=A0A0K1E660_CHOCO|nr:M1 family metallopeptidase [Chondromyces crocatus]AKT36360.1 peptidase M1 [Chondromyces crocatus]